MKLNISASVNVQKSPLTWEGFEEGDDKDEANETCVVHNL
jgi:hypothetical protein